jgi:hypothetical protein
LKAFSRTIVIALVLPLPAFAFPQSNGPFSRAQVRAELVELQQNGYDLSKGADTAYPLEIQAAEARVFARHATDATEGAGSASIIDSRTYP